MTCVGIRYSRYSTMNARVVKPVGSTSLSHIRHACHVWGKRGNWKHGDGHVSRWIPNAWRNNQRLPLTFIDRASGIDPLEVVDLLRLCDLGNEPFESIKQDCSLSSLEIARNVENRLRKNQELPLLNAAQATPMNADTMRKAMARSLVCVAAYCPEQYLQRSNTNLDVNDGSARSDCNSKDVPTNKTLQGLSVPDESYTEIRTNIYKQIGDIFSPRRGKVLVGFARAIGDASLVATVHDVCVHPLLRRRGLGSLLIDKITRKLWRANIIDVGAVVPQSYEAFFHKVRFGKDTENSVLMKLHVRSKH